MTFGRGYNDLISKENKNEKTDDENSNINTKEANDEGEEKEKNTETLSQKNAVAKAKSYLNSSAFSYKGRASGLF